MSLFGLFYIGINIGAATIDSLRNSCKDEENKRKTYDPELNTYIDHKGRLVDISTGRIKSLHRDVVTNHLILTDCISREKIDITEMRLEQKFLEMKKNPEVTHMKWSNDKHGRDKVIGFRYKDVNNGKFYVIRALYKSGTRMFNYRVLMDVETGYFVRLTDLQIQMIKKNHPDTWKDRIEELNKIIEERNNERKEKEQLVGDKNFFTGEVQCEFSRYASSNEDWSDNYAG